MTGPAAAGPAAAYVHRGAPVDPGGEAGQALLARLHAAGGEHLLCACLDGPAGAPPAPPRERPRLYLARAGAQVVAKRWPGTGHRHAPHCPHYEPPPELSGLGAVLGTAIVEGGPGRPTALRLAFALTRAPGAARPPPADAPAPDAPPAARHDGAKLSLRGLLHHLWRESGLDRLDPRREAPRRPWALVRERLLAAAAAQTAARGVPLAGRLLLPEPFHPDRKADIDGRRAALLAPLRARPPGGHGGRNLMVVLAELREIQPARSGARLALAHLGPAFPLHAPDDLLRRLRRRHAAELEMWESEAATAGAAAHPATPRAEGGGGGGGGGGATHHPGPPGMRLLLVGTFGLGPSGTPQLEEAALCPVTGDAWLPFDTPEERQLLEKLARERRAFVRGLRYNLAADRPLAAAVLTDTAPRAAALYLLPPAPTPDHRAGLAEIVARGTTAPWFWRTGEEALPPLPPRAERGAFDGMPLPVAPEGEGSPAEDEAVTPAEAEP